VNAGMYFIPPDIIRKNTNRGELIMVEINDEIKDALGVKSNNAQVYRYVAGL